jgi:hypothetical protein
MRVKVGDIVKIKVFGRVYWGRVTSYGFKFSAFEKTQEAIYFVEIFEKSNWGAITVNEKDILEVFIPEEKVSFT